MQSNSKAKQLIGYAFLVVLARERDGITPAEIDLLTRLASDDMYVSEDEKAVLRKLFQQIDHEEVVQVVVEGIHEFREAHGL